MALFVNSTAEDNTLLHIIKMVNIEAAAKSAYEDVRNDKTPTNYVILGYDDKGENLSVLKTGI